VTTIMIDLRQHPRGRRFGGGGRPALLAFGSRCARDAGVIERKSGTGKITATRPRRFSPTDEGRHGKGFSSPGGAESGTEGFSSLVPPCVFGPKFGESRESAGAVSVVEHPSSDDLRGVPSVVLPVWVTRRCRFVVRSSASSVGSSGGRSVRTDGLVLVRRKCRTSGVECSMFPACIPRGKCMGRRTIHACPTNARG
jgi:hypothetical protein